MQAVEDFIRLFEVERGDQERPLVTLAYAQSLDGSIAIERGKPFAISGPESMKVTHQLRAWHDGILIGIGTVLADNPQLTVRLVEGQNPQPIILDSNLRLPTSAALLRNEISPWIFSRQNANEIADKDLRQRGCSIFPFECLPGKALPLSQILPTLKNQGIKRLMVEGGATVIRSFLQAGLVDVVILTLAPIFVGGFKAVDQLFSQSIADPLIPRLSQINIDKVGADLWVWGRYLRQ